MKKDIIARLLDEITKIEEEKSLYLGEGQEEDWNAINSELKGLNIALKILENEF